MGGIFQQTTLNKIKRTREYLDYIEEHYNNVQKAWAEIQEKCKGMHFINDDFLFFAIEGAVLAHDESKLDAEEFTQYRQEFYPTTAEESGDFNAAWEHHKQCNSHHWENWTALPDNPLSTAHIVTNIIDWMAMSYKFGDTAQGYFEKNIAEIQIPDDRLPFMYEIFERLK